MSTTSRQHQHAQEHPTASSKARELDERRWNSACRVVGHDWQSTTSDTIRRCTRTGCQAILARKGDYWVYAPLQPKSKRSVGRRSDVEQPPLL